METADGGPETADGGPETGDGGPQMADRGRRKISHSAIRNPQSTNPQSAIDKSAIDKSTIDKSAIDKSTIDKSTIDKSTIDKSAIDKSTIYERLLFPLLSNMDAEEAHERTLRVLAWAQKSRAGRWLLRRIAGEIPDRPVNLWGLTFPNRLGVAAGFDKDARVFPGLGLLGFGHVEVGTITPWPQEGNPRPRVFRLPADQALINRLGFPNDGMVAVGRRLRSLRKEAPEMVVGVSLGKQKETSLERAVEDYISIMRSIYEQADYLAINISSPNTPGLRRLQSKQYLPQLLIQLQAENRNLAFVRRLTPRPVLVKIAPDLTYPRLDHILQAAGDAGISGMIVANTSISREGLAGHYPVEMGGLSGAPLAARSTAMIAYIHKSTGGKLPLVAVGGVFNAADMAEKLAAGAALVQVYTGLVYRGPGMAGRMLRNYTPY